jgi:tetratricopeptide (TPR) repeat protein
MKVRLALLAAVVASIPITLAPLRTIAAQSAAEHIALGDRDHANGNAASALRHYRAAVESDGNSAEALWRAAREAIDLGEFDDAKRDSLYRAGEVYARRAVGADPRSAMAHFALAKAIGRRALSLGTRERVKFAGDVRAEALESLRLDSINPGALHVMGGWNANIMRLSGVSRFLAKNLLGGRTFGEASWDEAARFLERASALEPDRIIHAVALAGIYRDKGEPERAREQYQRALSLKAADYNDKHYQKQAGQELAGLR